MRYPIRSSTSCSSGRVIISLVYRTVLLCGMAGGIAVGFALHRLAETDGAITAKGDLVPAKLGACGSDAVVDGRYQRIVVLACSDCAGIGFGLYPSAQAVFLV